MARILTLAAFLIAKSLAASGYGDVDEGVSSIEHTSAGGVDAGRSSGRESGASVLVFSRGFTCPHCSAQYRAFSDIRPDLERYGVDVVFIMPEAAASDDRKADRREAISIIGDADGGLSRKFAQRLGRADHGTFVLQADGGVARSFIGREPFMDVDAVLAAAVQTSIGVEIAINDSADAGDDYLTWGPSPARIRLRDVPPGSGPVTVVLTNDAEQAVPDGRDFPLDGNLAFDEDVAPGDTADQGTLSLTLPADGSWVPFVIAGAFPRASTRDKDAVIEAHLDDASGPVVGTHAAMVRVRKDINKLTPDEQTAFLKALHDLHLVKKSYETYPRMHDLAAKGKRPYQEPFLPDGQPNPKYWLDQAHGAAAFLPWHRAFLLQIERELQTVNPAVTIPYWRQNVTTTAFSPRFLGTNRRPDASFQTEVIYSPANWLYGWSIAYQNLKTVIRSPKDHSLLALPNGTTLRGEPELIQDGFATGYGSFRSQLEGNPHNQGHGLLGAWHANCLISPSDPSFWPFHAEHDRLWAKWQWHHGRFGTDSASYEPGGTFHPNDMTDVGLGHHLEDTMWPWDGTTGRVIDDANGEGNRPEENPFGPFPKAPASGLWPVAEAEPRPAEMIDYLGLAAGHLPHGACYDDVPYGVRGPLPSGPGSGPFNRAACRGRARDGDTPPERRGKALRALGALSPQSSGPLFEAIAADPLAPSLVRQDAVIGLIGVRADKGFELVLQLAEEGEQGSRALRETALDLAAAAHLALLPPRQRDRLHTLLRSALEPNESPATAARAAIALAEMNDPAGVEFLTGLLRADAPPPVPRAEIAAAVSFAVDDSALLMRQVLDQALMQNDEETALVALRSLAGDANSRQRRFEIADANPQLVGPLVRRAALRSLMRETPDVIPNALSKLDDGTPTQIGSMELESAGVFRVAFETQGPFPAAQVAAWKQQIQMLRNNVPDTVANGPEMRLALGMTLEVLDRAGQ